MSGDEFTIKQEKAIQNFLIHGNKTQAYRSAYNCSKMKPETVNRKAKDLFDKGKIRARIEKERVATWKRNQMTLDELLSRAADMIRADISLAYNENGSLKKLHEMPLIIRMAIVGVDTDEITIEGVKIGETKKIKKADPSKYFDMLMKHLGAYDKHNQQLKNNVTIFQLPDNGR